ncbi:MAG: hypothetical protein ACXAB2_07260 [Candidatus Hodarchaeales archaeon]|jgi:hypothetical protein
MKLVKRLNMIKPNKTTFMKYLPLLFTMLILISALAIGIADPTSPPPGPK